MPTAPKRMRAKYSPVIVGVLLEVVERAEESDETRSADEQVEEDGEGVDLDGAEEAVDAGPR